MLKLAAFTLRHSNVQVNSPFSSSSRFTDTQTIAAIQSKGRSLPHIRGGTRTDRALELAGKEFFGWENCGDRPDKPNVLLVLTDGNTNEGSKPFSQVMPPLNVSLNIFLAIDIFIIHGHIKNSLYGQFPVGLIAQLVEHCTGITEFMGSNPVQA